MKNECCICGEPAITKRNLFLNGQPRAVHPVCEVHADAADQDTNHLFTSVENQPKADSVNNVKSCQDQIQQDLLCLLDEFPAELQTQACQIVVDNFKKYNLC